MGFGEILSNFPRSFTQDFQIAANGIQQYVRRDCGLLPERGTPVLAGSYRGYGEGTLAGPAQA